MPVLPRAAAQTRVHLPSQSSQADFSQFPFTRPVKLGTVLPPSCLDGELFFKTDEPAGNNLYTCSASNWQAAGSGASAVGGLGDLKISAAGSTVSIAAGRVQHLESTGRYTVSELTEATVSRVAGADSGTLRLEVDSSGGTPVLRCWYGTGMNASNYAAAGCVTGSQSQFSAGAQPLGMVAISSGAWNAPVDLRALGGTANYLAGSGLTKAGNTFSVNPAVVGMLAGSNTWLGRQSMTPNASAAGWNAGSLAGDPTTLSDGDVWYNSAAGKLRCRQAGVSVNCTDGGIAAGGDTQIQFNDAGVLGGDGGLTWNKTQKALAVSKSASGAQVTAIVTSALTADDTATLQGCIGNDYSNCGVLRSAFTDFDGTGNSSWAALLKRSGAGNAPLVARGGNDAVHLGGTAGGGPLGVGPGWMTVGAGGVTRFANAATAGLGLAPISGQHAAVSQTGDLAPVALLGASHPAGTYRVCGTVSVTAAGTGSFGAWTIAWRDPSSGSDVVRNMAWDDNGTLTATPGLDAAAPYSAVCKIVRSTGASAIALDPGDGASAIFDVSFVVERIQ